VPKAEVVIATLRAPSASLTLERCLEWGSFQNITTSPSNKPTRRATLRLALCIKTMGSFFTREHSPFSKFRINVEKNIGLDSVPGWEVLSSPWVVDLFSVDYCTLRVTVDV
jgi:hypothetical protein